MCIFAVIEFAGDALICAFRNSSEGISESCFRALQCAHVLRQHKTASLSTHIGVTCGEMQIGLLGGHNDQWVYVMNGDCVSELAGCIEDAGPQEVAITEECYMNALECDKHPRTASAMRNQLQVDPKRTASGNYLLKNIGTRRTSTPPPPLSPFLHNPAEAAHHHAAWHAALKNYNHVHEVASDVMTKQRSDHLIHEASKKAAAMSLGADSMDLHHVVDMRAALPTVSAHAGVDHATEVAHESAASAIAGIAPPNGAVTAKSGAETTVTPNKRLGKKKSTMESYASPVMSLVSPSSVPGAGGALQTKLQSFNMKAKLTMVTPVFKSKTSLLSLHSDTSSPVGAHIEAESGAHDDLADIPLVPEPPRLQHQNGAVLSPRVELRSLPPVPDEAGVGTAGNAVKSSPDRDQVADALALKPPRASPTGAKAGTAEEAHEAQHSPPLTAASTPSQLTSGTLTPLSPGIAELASSPTARERGGSGADVPVLQLPPALKRGASQNRPLSQQLGSQHEGGHRPLSKGTSTRSVNFSACTSFSDLSDLHRAETPVSSAIDPNNLQTALGIARGEGVSITDPIQLKKPASRYDHFTPQSSHGSSVFEGMNKKRFGGWGVMKNALRRESFREKYKSTEAEFIHSVSKFVPRPVLNAVHTECLDLIGELRQVTTMFVALNSYSATANKDPCTLQPFFYMAQTALHEAGGFLRQFLVDDKGCVFLAMWGVPSFTYSNNCNRALYCAAKIIEGSGPLGHKVSIGIATGTVFCGSVGALERRDYAGVGTDVNMAARLMSKAHGRILIDAATYRSLNKDSQQLLEPAEEMHLKGAAAPIVPYQYVSTTLPRITDMDVESAGQSVLRAKMQGSLCRLLDDFLNVTADTTIELLEKKLTVTFNFLFGLPGTGKALAAQYYRNTARLRNINCLHLVAKADMQGVPYGLLRELFLELIGRNNFVTVAQKLSVVTALIDEICDETDTEEDRTSALESLQLVLGIEQHEMDDIRESIMSRPLSLRDSNREKPQTNDDEDCAGPGTGGSMRSRSTILMIRQCSSQSRKIDDYTFYNVVAHLLHNTPTVLIIENAHFIDELSWKELFMMQAGDQLDISVLLTMEVAHIPDGRYRSSDEEAVAATKQKSATALMNTSFSGDYWDAHEGQEEGAEVSEALNQSVDDVPESFANITLSPARGQSRQTTKAMSGTSVASRASGFSMDEDLPQLGMGARSNPTEFWVSILDNPSSTVLVMGEMSREEVRTEMARTLEAKTMTDGLVDLVYNITAGNHYWVKAMTEFIREQGAEQVFKAVSDRRSRQNPLKQLVLVHFETHLPEVQVISKHASIIGVEFDEGTLKAIVPPKLKASLGASLDKLVEKRFIQCLDPQDRTFCFPNQLIQTTIYELTPPR
jgi:class 3 adenylate cyclase